MSDPSARRALIVQITNGPFPICVEETLSQIVQFVNQYGNKWTRVKSSDLQAKIDYDLLCLNTDHRSYRISDLQKFKLMGMLCAFFLNNEAKDPRTQRRIYFDMIFCGREGEAIFHETRIAFLTKFCMMALQYPVYDFFEDVAQWLFKLGSGKMYADNLVEEIGNNFLQMPEKYNMYEYLIPLKKNAPQFAFLFLIYSINDATPLNNSLIVLINEWLTDDLESFYAFLKNHPPLAEKFSTQKFDLLLRYDCEKATEMAMHSKFHFIITSILLQWRNIGFDSTQNFALMKLLCPCLLQIKDNFDTLSKISKSYYTENLESFQIGGHIPIKDANFNFLMKKAKEDVLSDEMEF